MSCPSDETLTRLVEGALPDAERAAAVAHVEGCEGCRQVLAAVAGASRASVSATLASPTLPGVGAEEVPTVLGRYRVLREVGRGAMGRVFAAEDTLLGRTVALKLVATQVEDAALSARVASEARAVARLTHPNVVALHDVLQVGGWVFLAMEFVEGEDLAAWMSRPREAKAVVDVFAQAAAGLSAAHAAGVVHRDFKPANVLVGDDGRVRVSDFGLARLFDDVTTHAPGHLVGTPAYMAPEQLEGVDAGPASDQFAFFVALHEALGGARPFGAGTVEELKQRIRKGERTPPPRPLPRALAAVVDRGLAATPAQRFASMETARAALLATQRAPVRKRAVAAGALALAVVAAVAAVSWPRSPQAACLDVDRQLDGVWDAARRDAVQSAFAKLGKEWSTARGKEAVQSLDAFADAWRGARVAACEATKVRGDASQRLFDLRAWCLDQRKASLASVAEVLSKVDLPMAARTQALLAGLGDVAVCQDTKALLLLDPAPVDPAVRAKVDEVDALTAKAYALQNAGQFKEALAEATRADALALNFDVPRSRAEAAFRLGVLQRLTGEHAAAEGTLKRATEGAMRARLGDIEAQAWIERIAISHYMEKPKDGLQLAGTALAAIDRLQTNEPAAKLRHQQFLSTLHTALGHLSEDVGDYKAARAHFEKSLAINEAATGKGSVETATDQSNLSGVASSEGNPAEALERVRAAFDINHTKRGDEHPETARAISNLATELHRQREFEQALPLYERALALNKAIYGDSNREVAIVLDNLGSLLRQLKRADEGMKLQVEALAMRKAIYGDDSTTVATSCINIGTAYITQGKPKEALPYYECATAIFKKKGLEKHPHAILTLANLSETRHQLGDSKTAREGFLQVLALDEESLGAQHPSIAYDAVQLGLVEVALGLTADATVHFERAVALEGKADAMDVGAAQMELAKLALAQKPRDLPRARALLVKARVPFAEEAAKGRGSEELRVIDALLKKAGGP